MTIEWHVDSSGVVCTLNANGNWQSDWDINANCGKTILVFDRSAYNRLKKQNKEAVESELVEVQSDLKGHVIGKGGCNIREIMAKSGAKISSRRDEDSFLIRGDTEQRAFAKSLILEKVVSFYW